MRSTSGAKSDSAPARAHVNLASRGRSIAERHIDTGVGASPNEPLNELRTGHARIRCENLMLTF